MRENPIKMDDLGVPPFMEPFEMKASETTDKNEWYVFIYPSWTYPRNSQWIGLREFLEEKTHL